jgi:hypothetical protein
MQYRSYTKEVCHFPESFMPQPAFVISLENYYGFYCKNVKYFQVAVDVICAKFARFSKYAKSCNATMIFKIFNMSVKNKREMRQCQSNSHSGKEEMLFVNSTFIDVQKWFSTSCCGQEIFLLQRG